jgi:hypothetical protein
MKLVDSVSVELQERVDLEADLVVLAEAVGDDVLSRPRLVALLDTETIQRIVFAYLAEHAGLF